MHERNWLEIVERRLERLEIPEGRREQVMQELSEHLDDEFAALREQLPEDEAERQALNLLAGSDVLICEIRKAPA